ncbi:unnamed protein product, partial [Agarophyton chilense]
MNNAHYDSLPGSSEAANLLNTSSHAQVSERHVSRRFRVSLGSSKVRAVLAIAALVGTVLLVTDSSQFDRIYRRSRVSRVLPNFPTFWHRTSLYANTQFPVREFYNDFDAGAPRIPYFPSQSFIRTDSSIEKDPSDEEVVTEEAVPTGDCSGGLFCRARLVLTTKGTSTTVQAGYYIYPVSTRRQVDGSTQRRVKAVTQAEAMTWATQLLDKLGPKLAEVNCQLNASKIADAIMSTKEDASKCNDTESSLCSELAGLECEGEKEVEIENGCYKFIVSDSAIDDLHEL